MAPVGPVLYHFQDIVVPSQECLFAIHAHARFINVRHFFSGHAADTSNQRTGFFFFFADISCFCSSSNKIRDSSLAKPRLDHDEDSPVFEIRLRSLDLEAARGQPGDAAVLPASPPPRRHSWRFRTSFALPQVPMPAFFARSRGDVVVEEDDTPSQNSLGPMVDALLTSSSRSSSRRPRWSATTTTNSDDVAKAKVSHESVHVVSHWSSEEDLSSPRTGWPVAPPCQMSPVETRYRPSFLASAYVPKRAVAGIHGACRFIFPLVTLSYFHFTSAHRN